MAGARGGADRGGPAGRSAPRRTGSRSACPSASRRARRDSPSNSGEGYEGEEDIRRAFTRGLLGDDDFTIKVSPDGSAFHTALSIDKDTGHVGLAGATADANNALIVKGTAFLFDRETDDVRFTFNKATAGDDVALTFQSGYFARALFGLLGDDDFTVKVSPDGSNYFTGFVVDRSSGRFKLPLAPKFSAYRRNPKTLHTGVERQDDPRLLFRSCPEPSGNHRHPSPRSSRGGRLCASGFRLWPDRPRNATQARPKSKRPARRSRSGL